MLRIYETDEGTFRAESDTDGFDIELNENNYLANIHQDEQIYDRVAVEDPADQEWICYWSDDQEAETFQQLLTVAWQVGSILVRQTATEHVKEMFIQHHLPTEDDFNALLENNDGN